MKRLMIVVLAALCVAALLPQTLSAGFGIKGGYTLSKFSLTTSEPPPFAFVNLPYYTGGIYFSLKLGPLAIQPEVLYTRMGAKFAVDADSLEYRFDYIQVPVLLKLSVIPAGPIRPVIYAGGYGSYMLKANGVMTVGGVPEEEDLSEMFEKYDYGVVGGVGIEFKLPGISFSIEGRYNYGLKNILTDPVAGEAIKNRSMMALVGIGF
ncbi:MAG TPA: porin family protein [Candidatus Latescibacteria bacterium]|nr:porin family protein [Candidatus Latescibacterota bacterium]